MEADFTPNRPIFWHLMSNLTYIKPHLSFFAKILAVLVQPCFKSPMLRQSAEEFAEASACGFARHATSYALAYLATADSIEVAQVFRKGVEEAAGFAKCHYLPFCW